MKWVLLVVGAVALFVMLMFGMALIDSGQKELSNETIESEGYVPVSTSVEVIFGSLLGAPLALLIMAAIGVFYFLTNKTR